MKRQELLKELNKLSVEELNTRISESELELSNINFQAASQQLDNPIKLRQIRRDIARMKTVITQKLNETVAEVAND